MRSTSRTLTTVGVIAAVVAFGLWLGWFASRPPTAQAPKPEVQPSEPVRRPPAKNISGPLFGGRTNQAEVVNTPVLTETNLVTDWEERIDTILRDDSDVEEKARKMLALLPRTKPEGQAELARHISNLVADEDYPKFSNYLMDTNTNDEVLDVLMMDLLGRENPVKLSLLVEIASTPQHPKAPEAKETLELYLDGDFGDDWDLWREKVKEWLAENPE